MGIPVPYAFNYHFDQGIFRGLAFANFHSPAEANEVVAALNGLDVSGRKLRVEYKKVLQAGEKERIEKEKALKRLQIPHVGDKDRKKDKSLTPEMGHLPPMSLSPGPGRVGYPNMAVLNGLSSPSSASSVSPIGHKEGKCLDLGGLGSSPFSRYSESSGDSPLDLNDSDTLEIYSRVLLFKDDRMRDELAFSKCLTPAERRTVHLVAQKLGLYHYTLGGPDDCYVLVTKFERPGMEPRMDLRGKKSVPDLKRTPFHDRDVLSEMERSASPVNPNLLAPTAHVGARKSTASLREGNTYAQDWHFDTFGNYAPHGAGAHVFASPFDIPVVPHLPRPTSADIERLDHYPKPMHPPMFRSRSPLAPGPMHSSASSPAPISLAHSAGPLDASMPPPGAAPGLPHRPHPTRNMPVDLMLDGHVPKPRSRISPAPGAPLSDKREGRMPNEGQATDHDMNSPRPAPPTITKSSTIDDPSYS